MKISKKGKKEAGTRFNIVDDVFDIQGKKIKKGVVYRMIMPLFSTTTDLNMISLYLSGKVSADKAVLEAMLNSKNV
jgi:hypothetical protein